MPRITEVVDSASRLEGEATAALPDFKRGLPPIARADAKVLILGSLPGDASITASQYYAHPRNHFWKLLSGVVGQDLVLLDYSQRIQTIQESGFALWDVVGSAQRIGSLDHQIRNEQLNDLRKFVTNLAELRAVAFNGKKAAALAGNVFDSLPVDVVQLPSSSPAHTMHPDAKAGLWTQLSLFLDTQK